MNRRRLRLFRRSPAPLTCEEVAEVLQQYLDDQTGDDLARLLSAHLDDCRRCGLEADTYRRIKQSLAGHRGPVPEDSLARLREFGARLSREGQPASGR
jgi:hypothetical protein